MNEHPPDLEKLPHTPHAGNPDQSTVQTEPASELITSQQETRSAPNLNEDEWKHLGAAILELQAKVDNLRAEIDAGQSSISQMGEILHQLLAMHSTLLELWEGQQRRGPVIESERSRTLLGQTTRIALLLLGASFTALWEAFLQDEVYRPLAEQLRLMLQRSESLVGPLNMPAGPLSSAPLPVRSTPNVTPTPKSSDIGPRTTPAARPKPTPSSPTTPSRSEFSKQATSITHQQTLLATNRDSFSGIQGARGWRYLMEAGRNSGLWREMVFDGKCWRTGGWERDVRICAEGEIHPGHSSRVAYEWRSELRREIVVTVHAHKIDTRAGDGVWIGTFVGRPTGPRRLGEFRIGGGDNTGITRSYKGMINAEEVVLVLADIGADSVYDLTRVFIDIYADKSVLALA